MCCWHEHQPQFAQSEAQQPKQLSISKCAVISACSWCSRATNHTYRRFSRRWLKVRAAVSRRNLCSTCMYTTSLSPFKCRRQEVFSLTPYILYACLCYLFCSYYDERGTIRRNRHLHEGPQRATGLAEQVCQQKENEPLRSSPPKTSSTRAMGALHGHPTR